MTDVMVVMAIVLAAAGGGLYVASRPVRPSRREIREIEILKSLERIEEKMKQHAKGLLPYEVPDSSAACAMPFHNRERLDNCRVCGCCNYLQVFVPELIKHWTDDGLTACCPFCGIDGVVSDRDGVSLNVRTILSMHHEHFVRRPAQHAEDPDSSLRQEKP
jgi:hypothetical protein